MQTFSVPANTYITIDVYGAEGGANSYSSPGKGAKISGTFTDLPQGKVLKILVGGQGGSSPFSGGGGGGSFVVDSATNNPLIIAGGGGGAYWWGGGIGGDTLTNGTASQNNNAGGTDGNGGTASNSGGGGGGLTGNGANGGCVANGGQSFINGGAGGTGACFQGYEGTGGFGGGGGGTILTGNAEGGGGGGGGYSGGAGGGDGTAGNYVGGGGGGGSFNAGMNPSDSANVHSGNGLIRITVYSTVNVKSTPEANFSPVVYPNPVNTYAAIDYELTTPACVTLEVYSTSGQKISVVSNTHQLAGHHTIQWNLTDEIAAGIYSYRLLIGETQKTGILIVQK
jgi:hypothetical protein